MMLPFDTDGLSFIQHRYHRYLVPRSGITGENASLTRSSLVHTKPWGYVYVHIQQNMY